MNLLDLSLKINGYPISKAKRKLKAIQEIEIENYKDFIEHQKKEIVEFHLKNNSFYKSLIKKDNFNWESLPILEKKNLQIPLEKRLSKGFSIQNVFKNKTSGSSGTPFYFAKDKFSHALTWSVIYNRFSWHNLYGKKQARFYGIPKNGFSRKKELIKDFFSNRYRFDVFDLSENAIEKWLTKFKNTNFVFLNGYTSVIVFFAKYLVSKNIVLKDICPTLKACVVTSEMLFDKDRKILKKGYGVPVINEYGASELDLIAFEDTNGDWILNTSTLFVEIIDNNFKVLKEGQVGDIVITSLFNKAHPFIRYKIGDRGAIKKINSKKFILEKLEGRSEDIVKLPSGKVAPGLTFYYITKSIMEDTSNIKEIKVIQLSLNTFQIEYVSKNKLNTKEEINIKEALINYLEPNLNISFVKIDNLERSKSGKLKQFTSFIKE
jgi:phenylacetate-CoA ligase